MPIAEYAANILHTVYIFLPVSYLCHLLLLFLATDQSTVSLYLSTATSRPSRWNWLHFSKVSFSRVALTLDTKQRETPYQYMSNSHELHIVLLEFLVFHINFTRSIDLNWFLRHNILSALSFHLYVPFFSIYALFVLFSFLYCLWSSNVTAGSYKIHKGGLKLC